jgi:hypothetical protein
MPLAADTHALHRQTVGADSGGFHPFLPDDPAGDQRARVRHGRGNILLPIRAFLSR